MAGNRDSIELLRALNEEKADYMVVGGYAVMKYSEPQFTKNLDIWIDNSRQNADRVYRALARFGAPLESDRLTAADFASADMTYQIGIEPARADILTHISGVVFADARRNKVSGTLFGVPVNFISLPDLIANKRATGRSSDIEQLADLLAEMKKNADSK